MNEIHVDSLREDQKEFVKNNKLMLKTQQGFKSEKHNVFIGEILILIILSSKKRKKEHNRYWPEIPDHLYGIIIWNNKSIT